jgi:HPt (histidine-containing phosphotransfer) domain-containing protein
MEQLPLFDESVLGSLRRFGKPAFLVRMVDMFLGTTGGPVQQAVSSAATGDWDSVAFAAHSLKSSAGSLGLPRLTGIVQGLEVAARSRNSDAATVWLSELRRVWEDSCATLAEYRGKL